MDKFFHSVTLDKPKCVGCTNCIKRCPTEAIRVRYGKAQIKSERCIDCGECIRICPHHAKRSIFEHFSKEALAGKKYTIALPPPSLYGQYNNFDDIDLILTGIKRLGFDHVVEVSRGAEIVSEATRLYMTQKDVPRPVISSACPAVLRLIRVRFPDLCSHVLPIKAPMEVAALMAKKEASAKTGLPIEDIGAYFISPCPAKITDVRAPISQEKSHVDGTFAMSDLYPALLNELSEVEMLEPLSQSGVIGVSWGGIGGESSALLHEQYLAADGIENVIHVLEDLEDERFHDLDFIELNACSGGCVGGVLAVENPYVAKARLQRLRKYLPVSCNHLQGQELNAALRWSQDLEFAPVMKLSEDIAEAMDMMGKMDALVQQFPGIDCGACGAPSCRALAEDIVKGTAKKSDCMFVLKEQLRTVASALNDI